MVCYESSDFDWMSSAIRIDSTASRAPKTSGIRETNREVRMTSPFYTLSTDQLLERVLGRMNYLERDIGRLSPLKRLFDRIRNRYQRCKVYEISFKYFETDLQVIFKALLDLIYPGVEIEDHFVLHFVRATTTEGWKMKKNRTIGLSEWSPSRSRTQICRTKFGTRSILEGELDLWTAWENDAMVMMERYVGTLGHEVSHMVTQVNCYPQVDGVGLTGHGPVWQRLAYRTECFLRRHLGFDVDLGRMNSMIIELDATWVELPLDDRTRALILSVGLKPNEVERETKLERAAIASNGVQSRHTAQRGSERVYQSSLGQH